MTFGAPRRPPRLVVRTLIATFGAIAVVLGAAFFTLTIAAFQLLCSSSEVFERLNRGCRGVFDLQVAFEDVDVVIEPLPVQPSRPSRAVFGSCESVDLAFVRRRSRCGVGRRTHR